MGANSMTLLADWQGWLRIERGLADGTIRSYRRELEALAEAYDGKPLDRLTAEDLRYFLHVAGGNPATVARRIAAWSSFYRWLVRVDRRDDDPTLKLDRPKLPKGLPHPVEDFERRVAALDPEFRAIAVFLVSTGLRISEACAVECGVPVPNALRVTGKGSKTRIVPLMPAAKAALTQLGGRISYRPRTIQRHFRAVGFHPHALRHTAATRLADADVDVLVIKELLGHESVATTQIYSKVSPQRLRREMERALL